MTDDTRIAMQRTDLCERPLVSVPEGFTVRGYRPGDEAAWRAIHEVADPRHAFTAATFGEQFGTDVATLAARQCYLTTNDGTSVGTATAWFGDGRWGEATGRVHWMAIVPEYQGRGLARPLLSIVLDRLVELDHERAYLTTSTARIPAVNLYLKFGFVPALRCPEERDRWCRLANLLKYPVVLPPADT